MVGGGGAATAPTPTGGIGAQESKPQTRRKYATRAERDRAFYERHRERLLALQRAYRRANRAALAEQAHARYLANREARAAYSRAYKLTNRERINAQRRAASAAARERVPDPILPAENPC